jgi:hypothetical protein
MERGYFRPRGVSRLLEDHVDGRADNGYRLWNLAVLELWHRAWIDA